MTILCDIEFGNGQKLIVSEHARLAFDRGYLVAPARAQAIRNEFYDVCLKTRRPFVSVRLRVKYADFVADMDTAMSATWDEPRFRLSVEEEAEQAETMREMGRRAGARASWASGGGYQFAHKFLPDDAEALARWVVERFAEFEAKTAPHG